MIRPMQDGDAAAVIALWHAAGVARPWNDPGRDLAFARRDAHAAVLVAEADGRIVATCMVGEDGHRGWVYYLAVDPGRRGEGHGRAMMAAAERWLAERGAWKMQLLVRADNAAVVDFYEHLGFRDTRTVCLQKVIGEA
ncbi:GNAT family acetyltransferase [Methylobacterium sp. A54F]